MKTTGLSSAPSIPVGATLESTTWQVPGWHGAGPSFDTIREALVWAIADMTAAVARHADSMNRSVPLPERITIDLRWTLRWPAPPTGGAAGLSTPIERYHYDDLADAQAHLERIDRYTPATA